jgi:hypothetical protein
MGRRANRGRDSGFLESSARNKNKQADEKQAAQDRLKSIALEQAAAAKGSDSDSDSLSDRSSTAGQEEEGPSVAERINVIVEEQKLLKASSSSSSSSSVPTKPNNEHVNIYSSGKVVKAKLNRRQRRRIARKGHYAVCGPSEQSVQGQNGYRPHLTFRR